MKVVCILSHNTVNESMAEILTVPYISGEHMMFTLSPCSSVMIFSF